MVRVLFDHQIFSRHNFGGISTYFAYVYANLKKIPDISVKLPVVLSSNVNLDMVEPSGLKHLLRNVDIKGKTKIQYAINELVNKMAIKSQNFDVFHPTYYDTYFLPLLKNKPFVITIFDMIHELFPEMFNSAEVATQKPILAKQATHLIAISEATKKDIVDRFGIQPEKISVVYMAGDNINYVMNDPTSIGKVLPKKYILFVGQREAAYKNFTNFVKGIAPLLQKDTELHLVTAGGGSYTEKELTLFKELKIENKVVSVPLTNKAPIQRFFYENAALYANPAIYEGFGIPIVEAFMCECPTAISNTSCFPEIAQDATTYFDPYNPESITEAVEKALTDEDTRKEHKKLGALRAKDFTWEKSAQKSKQIYESLV